MSGKRVRNVVGVAAILSGACTAVASLVKCPAHAPSLWPGEIRSSDTAAKGVTTVEQALAILPRYTAGGNNPTPYQRALGIEDLVRARFYHGYSEYSFCDNWSLKLASYIRPSLLPVISPEDVLKYPYAGCSQQGLVVQELLNRSNLEFGTFGVRYPVPHFASVVKLYGEWYFIDTWGPLPRGRHRLIPVRELFSGKRLAADFPTKKGAEFVHATNAGLARISHLNEFPGPRGLAFQQATGIFSKIGWLVLTLLWLALSAAKRRGAERGR